MASRWAGLADARAAELLAGAHGGGTVAIVGDASALPLPALAGQTWLAPQSLGRSAATFDTVLDATRPEEPADHDQLLTQLLRRCRPAGTLATLVCAGVAKGRPGGPRALSTVRESLAAAGWVAVQVVPTDVLGVFSPWRQALGARRLAVLAELERRLRARSVRAAARLLEREVVAALPAAITSRALVVARRQGPPAAEPAGEGVASALRRPEVATRVLRLMHHDPVVRFAAFLDAEVLAPLGARFDAPAYLLALAQEPALAGAMPGWTLARGRWWFPGLEARRFMEAVVYRMARRCVRLLATAGDDAGLIADSFTYPVLDTCARALDPYMPDPWNDRSSS